MHSSPNLFANSPFPAIEFESVMMNQMVSNQGLSLHCCLFKSSVKTLSDVQAVMVLKPHSSTALLQSHLAHNLCCVDHVQLHMFRISLPSMSFLRACTSAGSIDYSLQWPLSDCAPHDIAMRACSCLHDDKADEADVTDDTDAEVVAEGLPDLDSIAQPKVRHLARLDCSTVNTTQHQLTSQECITLRHHPICCSTPCCKHANSHTT